MKNEEILDNEDWQSTILAALSALARRYDGNRFGMPDEPYKITIAVEDLKESLNHGLRLSFGPHGTFLEIIVEPLEAAEIFENELDIKES